jgi:hypothetical protein
MKIRAAVHAILAEISAFESVFNARSVAVRRSQLPAVRIYITHDEWQNQTQAHDLGFWRAVATLTVQVIVEAGEDPKCADQLDILCAVVKHALLTDARFRQYVHLVEGITTDIQLDDAGEQRTAIGTLEFAVHYAECTMRDFGDLDDEVPDPTDPEAPPVARWKRTRFGVDVIDPAADPNTGKDRVEQGLEYGYRGGFPGPDGRIEADLTFNFPEKKDEP